MAKDFDHGGRNLEGRLACDLSHDAHQRRRTRLPSELRHLPNHL